MSAWNKSASRSVELYELLSIISSKLAPGSEYENVLFGEDRECGDRPWLLVE